MMSVQAYRKLSKPELLSELVDTVDALCEVIDELGFVKGQKGNSPERYPMEAQRDVLTERKYLLVRLLEYGNT